MHTRHISIFFQENECSVGAENRKTDRNMNVVFFLSSFFAKNRYRVFVQVFVHAAPPFMAQLAHQAHRVWRVCKYVKTSYGQHDLIHSTRSHLSQAFIAPDNRFAPCRNSRRMANMCVAAKHICAMHSSWQGTECNGHLLGLRWRRMQPRMLS